MAWDGYLTFAGTEIINRARTQRYMKDAAPGVLHECDCDCTELHKVVGDAPYSNPAMDGAPWYDPDVPESAEFYGLYPLRVQGLEDSTRTATVVESLGPGGSITGRRRATKEVRVRGLLLASTDRGLQYGNDWLDSVLDGACASCEGDALCFFSACPDPDAVVRRQVENTLDAQVLTTDGGNWDGLTFTPLTPRSRLLAPRLTEPLPSRISYEWAVQGKAGEAVWIRIGGEDEGASTAERFVLDGDIQRFIVEDRGWSSRWVSSSLSVGDPAELVPSNTLSPGQGLSPGYQGVVAERPPSVKVHEVKVRHAIEFDDDFAASTAYLRQLREVSGIEGPTLIQERRAPSVHLREIDFTLAAMIPHVFSQEIPIISMYSGRPQTTMSGTIQKISVAIPDCQERSPVMPDLGPYGIVDPDLPRMPPPPILDSLPRPGGTMRPEDNYVITIPDAALPTWTDMLPTLRLGTSSLPVRNVRVRFFPVSRYGMSHTDLSGCDACGGFVISYIPPNSEITLDGATQKATIRFRGTFEDHSATHLLASDAGQVFTWPVLSCGMGYFAAVDVDFVLLPVLSLSLVARR